MVNMLVHVVQSRQGNVIEPEAKTLLNAYIRSIRKIRQYIVTAAALDEEDPSKRVALVVNMLLGSSHSQL